MHEPEESRSDDQHGYDVPTVPYVSDEPHNPYSPAVPGLSDEPPPAESEQVIPESASPHSSSAASQDILEDQSPKDPNTVYEFPEAGTFATTEATASSATIPDLEKPSPVLNKRGAAFWFSMGVLATLLLVGILSTSGYFLYSYINRSTPLKTLDAFCEALQREDYENAYQSFSRHYQNTLTEADFAAVLSADKIVGCSHGAVDDTTTITSTNLKLVHNSRGVNNDVVTLTKDTNNDWKINDLRNAQ